MEFILQLHIYDVWDIFIMKKVVIIGAGPAGLSAAVELSQNPDIEIIIYEAESQIGGLARTLEYKGNKIDIGPHRFFSKSDEIVEFWKKCLGYKESGEKFLLKDRFTRIYFLNKFFNYPITFDIKTALSLGPIKIFKILISYFKSALFPIKDQKNLEDFFINRFGKELYLTFFKSYTEKVWGIPVNEIPSDWGGQRIKGLSITKMIISAVKSVLKLSDKNKETSLTDFFYYPEDGAGMMWQKMAEILKDKGGQIYLNKKVVALKNNGNKVVEVSVKDINTGEIIAQKADYVVSSMPVKELINNMNNIPAEISEIANNLVCRDMVLLGLIFKKFKNKPFPDNWIYLHDKNVKAGRMEIYNNFSMKMLEDKNTVSIGLEYFCNQNDETWQKSDEELIKIGIKELSKMKFFNEEDFIAGNVYRIEKAYPAYFGSYNQLDEIVKFTDKFENLFLIGRNGMHRYNNMDHSVMCGLAAARNIMSKKTDKTGIWNINLEDEYHEVK